MGMDPEPTAGEPAAEPVAEVAPSLAPIGVRFELSDEGVPFEWMDTTHLLNLADVQADPFHARFRELHVHGVCFAHVSEARGMWVYRDDR